MANIEPVKTSNRPVSRSSDLVGTLRDELDRVFERFDSGWPSLPSLFGRGGATAPRLDVHDDGKAITIEAELPGVAEKDVKVTLTDGVLTVKGEKKDEREEKQANYYLSERSYGSFERSLRLPDGVDEGKVEAHFDKGVLRIVAPKKAEAVKPERTIEIKAKG